MFGDVAGAGKTTTLHWLSRLLRQPEELCLQFTFKHNGKSTHTTKLTSGTMFATRVFDTPGLPSFDSSAAYGMKWAAGGFWKEGCAVTYLQRPTNESNEPEALPNTNRCMNSDPSSRTTAHSVLLLLRFADTAEKIDEYAAFLKILKNGETTQWRGKTHYLKGIEPVIAVTHAPCLGNKKAPCTAVNFTAVELFTKRLAHAADGDNALLLAPESSALCELHQHGRLCSREQLNFLPPSQYKPVLYALKAKAIAHIKAVENP
jgi:hypothetical protein